MVNEASVLIDHTYADPLGNLAVKRRFGEVAGLVSAPSAAFALVLNEKSQATDTVSVQQRHADALLMSRPHPVIPAAGLPRPLRL
jgi:hypothetical protein